MITHVLQDWVTLTFLAGTSAVRQSEQEWLELDGFRDCTLWVASDVESLSYSFTLALETAPAPDDALFQTLLSTTLGLGSGAKRTTTVVPYRGRGATTQLGRYLRWSVTPSGSGFPAVSLRMLLSLNPVVPEFRLARNGQQFTNPMLTRSLDLPMGATP